MYLYGLKIELKPIKIQPIYYLFLHAETVKPI